MTCNVDWQVKAGVAAMAGSVSEGLAGIPFRGPIRRMGP